MIPDLLRHAARTIVRTGHAHAKVKPPLIPPSQSELPLGRMRIVQQLGWSRVVRLRWIDRGHVDNALARHALQDSCFSDVIDRFFATPASTQQYRTAANNSCSAIVESTKLRSSRSTDQSATDALNALEPGPVQVSFGVQLRDFCEVVLAAMAQTYMPGVQNSLLARARVFRIIPHFVLHCLWGCDMSDRVVDICPLIE